MNTDIPFFRSARFASKAESGAAYTTIQQLLRNRQDLGLFVYRLLQTCEQPNHAPSLCEYPHDKPWYVIVLYEKIPPTEIEKQIVTALSKGEDAAIPDETKAFLQERVRITKAALQESGRTYYEKHHLANQKE